MERELSLVIQNPEQGQFLKHIDWNRQAFMELVSGLMEQYKGMVFTEDQIKEAKAERARLNAMKKAISDRRIQVKNEVMAPYTQFEAEVKEIVALIDKPISEIDRQIKSFEERQKSEKKDALREFFEEIARDLSGILGFEQVFEKRYLNVSVSLQNAKNDIRDHVDKIRADLKNIETIEPEYRIAVQDAYLKSFDLGMAFGEMYRMKELKRKEQERQEAIARQEAAEREMVEQEKTGEETATKEAANVAEQPKAEPEHNAPTPASQPVTPSTPQQSTMPENSQSRAVPPAQEPFTPQPKPKQYKASFMVYGTKEEIFSVRQFMMDHNIRFGKVEK